MISILDKRAEVVFMNFGYHDPDDPLVSLPEEEVDRYSRHLYDQLVRNQAIEGKQILEVGCGRGGGLAYVVRRFGPSAAVGMDLSGSAVDFCRLNHPLAGLSFMQGNAQQLPFADESFDFVLNVESSHRYENIRQFFSEVRRVLRPGGTLMMADFRRSFMMEKFHQDIRRSGMQIKELKDITPNVILAIEAGDVLRRDLVKRLTPAYLRKLALEFAGVKNSDVYRNFRTGKWVYFNCILEKPV